MDQKLSSPQIFLWRMILFLIIAGFVTAVVWRATLAAFLSNPFLNGTIVAVLVVGILLAIRQVARLFREVNWVNALQSASPDWDGRKPPVLLAPMAGLIGERTGRFSIGPAALRSILDSVGARLDEDRDISRYLTGLLVFLGLLGTFWGLTETVTAIGTTIQALDMRAGDIGVVFEELKAGLAAPLAGMGTAFSSSLFGLAGSLVLGFLDLQAGQAQNRFYKELEDWLSTRTEVESEIGPSARDGAATLQGVQAAVDRLSRSIAEGGGSSRQTTAAMANLAEGIQGLVQHMRSEQQLIRDWVEAQAAQGRDTKRALEQLVERLDRKPPTAGG